MVRLTINNGGTITVGPLIDGAGINASDGILQLTNQSTGTITQMGNVFGFFMRIRTTAGGSIIDNYGTFDVDQNDVGNDFLLVLANASITNRQGGLIMVENSEEDVFNLEETGITFDNYGTIDLSNGDNQGFDADAGTTTVNHSTGVIKITEMDDEAIDLEGTFINDGTIEIINTDGPPEGSDEAIDLDDDDAVFINRNKITIQNIEDDEAIDIEGRFENEGIINVGLAASTAATFPAFLLESDGRLINTKCGIINITTAHPIENAGAISNNGVITSVFTGNNINNGTFSNGGSISNIGGVFRTTGTNVGGLINNSPIPANISPFCNPFIPTLSQWGLLIFMLLVLNLGLMGIKRKEMLNTV